MQIGSFGADPSYAQMDALSTPSWSPATQESTASAQDAQEPADSVTLGEADENDARDGDPAKSESSEIPLLLQTLKNTRPLNPDHFKIKTPTTIFGVRG